jgi:hypothetical protein
MAGHTRRTFGLRALGAIASAIVGSLVMATPALAATVSGADSYVSAGQRQMAVLTVDGSAGETVYVRVTRDGEVLADRLEYTLSDAQGQVALDFSRTVPFDPSRSYVVTAFDSRDEAGVLYEGTIRPIYATLAGGGRQLIAVSTKGESDADRSFVAPESLAVGTDRVFTLTEGIDGTYSYAPAEGASSVTGTLSYVTDDGTVVASTTVDGITPSQSKVVDVAATVEAEDGSFYRVVRFSDTVELSYLANSATVRVKPAEASDGYYVAQVRMVAEDGTVLATDSLSVTKKYAYTAPSSLSMAATDANGRLRYETYKLVSDPVVTFEPGDAYSESGEPAVFTYHKVTPEENSEPEYWTVVVENIAAEQTRDREIERTYFEVKPGETASYEVAAHSYVAADGTELVPVASSKGATYSYEYGSGASPVAHVYVAPAGYEDTLKPYELNVRYVNIATGEVIRTQVVEVSETNADTIVDFPEEFVEEGVTYLLIKGQSAFAHNYFNRTRSYTIYYRDANDTLNADVVIRRINTITLPGETIFVDGGTTTVDGGVTIRTEDATVGAAGVGGTTGDGATVVGTLGDDSVVIDTGDGTAAITTLGGEDAETVRIDDQANPLAGPDALGGAQSGLGITAQSGVAIAAIAGLGIALVFFVVWKRRNKKQTANADNDGEVM